METRSAFLQGRQPRTLRFPDFPGFFDHCGGYNSTLGPTEEHLSNIVNLIINKQKPFFSRMEGAILGSQLSADHHHNVPG